MATNVQNVDSITLGNGILYVGTATGRNVGLLLNDVTFNYTVDMLRLEAGIPIMLVKQAKRQETATLAAELCEITPDNLQLMMGISSDYVSTVSGTSTTRITFGGAPGGLPEVPITFVHTRPDGNTITIFFNKAQTSGSLDFAFTDGSWISTEVTFEAVADASAATGAQLGYLEITNNAE